MKIEALIVPALVLAGTVHAASAQEPSTGNETARDPGDSPLSTARIEGIAVGTYQSTSQDRVGGSKVNDEANGQIFLFGEMDMGPGTWGMEVRGGTTPHDDGVTSFYGEVNDTVGETLNSDGKGRFAVTQLYYSLPVAGGDLSMGLLDASGLLDVNQIADDEYTQFMGSPFVNNPSVEYPDFALGANYHVDFNDTFGYQVFVSSTGGLEDEDDPTYGNVFDVGESGKGVFVANELLWETDYIYGSLGAWYNGSDHTEFASPSRTDKANYGAYTSAGGDIASGQWVAWGGIANDKVSAASDFLGLAYSQPLGDMTLGMAVSRTGDSDDLPGRSAAIKQAELYLRIPVANSFYVTPDVQYVDNSGFDPDRDGALVAGLRAGLEF